MLGALCARIRTLLRSLRHRSQEEQEMADELQFHLEARADDLMLRHRIPREEALRRARLEFGSMEKYKEEGREARGLRFFDVLKADTLYSLRQLRRFPAFTGTAIIVITLGVGVNAAMFSLINGSLLKPLPVRNPEQLTRLATVSNKSPIPSESVSYPDLEDYRKATNAFEDITAWSTEFWNLSVDGRVDRLIVTGVTGNFFSMLGVQPFMGRLIRPVDGELGGSDPVVVLGYSYWSHRLAKDPAIVGKQVKFNGKPFTVIGVVPESFRGVNALVEFDAYVPMEFTWTKEFLPNRSLLTVRALARLKPGVAVDSAQAVADTISWRLQDQYSDSNATRRIRVFEERRARPEPAVVAVMPTVITTLLLLSGAVLLIACANVLSLFLARGLARRGEMAVRATLGASRWEMIRVCMVEAALISIFGGVAGTLAGCWAAGLLDNRRLQGFEGVPLRIDVTVDWHVIAYSALLTLITTLIVGTLPAIRSSRTDPNADLHERSTPPPRRQRLRQMLVGAQLAVSVAFLIVAGMFVQSLSHLDSLDLGYARDHMLLVAVDPAAAGYDRPQVEPLYRRIHVRLAELPGVRHVSEALLEPFGDSEMTVGVSAEGATQTNTNVVTEMNVVSPDYFADMSIPLLRGRRFIDADDDKRSTVAIINEAMAAQLWPGQEAIGKRFNMSPAPDHWIEVIGVVRGSKQTKGMLPRSPMPAQVFLNTAQSASLGMATPLTRFFYVKTQVAPESLLSEVQSAIRGIDGSISIPNVSTLENQVRHSPTGFGLARTAVYISAILGFVGLALALVGTYGALAFMVGQRTQEIGIRVALGANPRNVVGLVVWQGVKLAAGAGIAGVALGAAVGRLLQDFLFDVSPTDPLIMISVIGILMLAAALTCVIPARKATAIDPILALKCE